MQFICFHLYTAAAAAANDGGDGDVG